MYTLQAFLFTMFVLCFAGDILGHMRVLIETGSQVILNEIGHGATIPEKDINTIFAGALVEEYNLPGKFLLYITIDNDERSIPPTLHEVTALMSLQGGACIFYIFTHAFVQFGQK